jgi:hypothetical protein
LGEAKRNGRQRQKQIPFGNDRKKGKGKDVVSGLHPTHRKVRDGWGTRAVGLLAEENKQRQKQIPFGDDGKKSDGKSNGNRNGKIEIQGSFAALRMTAFFCGGVLCWGTIAMSRTERGVSWVARRFIDRWA